jgi:hypothetical protein
VLPVVLDGQALREVLDGIAEVTLQTIRAAEVAVRRALPRPVRFTSR